MCSIIILLLNIDQYWDHFYSPLTNVTISSLAVTNTASGQMYRGSIVSPPSIELTMPLLFGTLHPSQMFQPLRNQLEVTSSFIGCVRDLLINSGAVGLHTSAPYDPRTDPLKASPGCPREEQCSQQPCANDAECSSDWQGFTCHCTRDYYGDTCSEGK